jgi:hypothetical protein
MARGLLPSGRAKNCKLIRRSPDGRNVVESVNLAKIASGVRPPLYMQSGDTLIVGSSWLAKLAEFIKPSVSAGVNAAPIGPRP